MTDTIALDEFVGKKVVLVRNLKTKNAKGELAEEVEGTLEAANPMGVMLKPKGQVKAEIIEIGDIDLESIRLAPVKEKPIKAKLLKPIQLGQAKSHLLERHGLKLTAVNGMSEDEAFQFHKTIDHGKLDLGHVHGEKPASEAADAVADEEAKG